ncbi:30S ribosomal protein S17, chloroplastic-like [Ananas comosus]|uniref:Small ribosomal subunit protein uS17c n=1 Tax=Ananas comosus TaxID=4615 RepID=A0A199VG94_ANACO|nr:30S ribosomal protein S17, chloroplastic-like [Ananas comosus]XP_020097348.1 30S ribosomal protein S17, chloroplastic-like [Ananas comosus]OAY76033.1 30S ribosomal protein S17, chloroplastic [Ananas comosus]
MLLTSPFLHPPSSSSSLTCSTFLHGPLPLPANFKTLTLAPSPPPSSLPVVRAMKKLQGRVVCATNDKTVAVEVVRLAPHPKYKRRVRKKKKYQAHDPENLFKVGDFVQLEKSRPISKTKTFLAVPVAARNAPKPVDPVPSALLDLPPLQSQQQPTAPQE